MNELLAELEKCYTDYLNAAKRLPDEYSPVAGVLGVGSGPKGDPCHEKFYNDAKETANFLAELMPDSETARAAVDLILKAAVNNTDADYATMMLVAAQAHAIPLIEYLTPEDAADFLKWYDRQYPRRTRLPIQKDVGKALSARARA